MPTIPVEDALLSMMNTDGVEEYVHPFHGGNHVWRTEEFDGKPLIFLDVDGHSFHVGEAAIPSALKKVPGVSDTIVSHWPPRMVVEPLNYFFDTLPGEFKMLTQGDELRSITRAKTIMFNPQRVLEIMVEAVGAHSGHGPDNIQIDDFTHSLEETAFTVIDPEGERFVEARPGDRTLGTLGFRGSMLGRFPLSAYVRTRRVSCSNGMVSPLGHSHFTVGGEDEDGEDGGIVRLEHWLQTETASLFAGSRMDDELARVVHLTEHEVPLEAELQVLSDMQNRYSISQGTLREITEALSVERDGTMYGIVQALTRVASHSPQLNMSQRNALHRHAGDFTYHAQEVCDTCRRALN
jgi:hypothetical protein